MARRWLKAVWKRPANKFLVSLIAFLLTSWLCYYGLSVLIGPIPANDDLKARSSERLANSPVVVARFKPGTKQDIRTVPDIELPLLAAENRAEPEGLHTKPSAVDPVTDQAWKAIVQADALCNAGKIVQARRLVNRFVRQHANHAACDRIRDYAIDLGEKTILSSAVATPDDHLCTTYTVKPGERLGKIARNCKVPYRFICRINKISDPRRLRAGQVIKLVRGPVNMVVIKHKFAAYLYLQDTLFAKYPVGLGRNKTTPTGTWQVAERVKDPIYTDPDTKKVYAGKDPSNPTAGYWIALKGLTGQAVGKTGFGIHGTIETDSIGKSMSKGCIRMLKRDMAEVFDTLSSGSSRVTVRP